jgi:hypothetical protein
MNETTILTDLTTVWVKISQRRWEMIAGQKGVLYQDINDKQRFKFRGQIVTADTPTKARQKLESLLDKEHPQEQKVEWVSFGKGMVIVGDLRGRLYRNKNKPNQWRWKDYVFIADSAEHALDHLTKLRNVG